MCGIELPISNERKKRPKLRSGIRKIEERKFSGGTDFTLSKLLYALNSPFRLGHAKLGKTRWKVMDWCNEGERQGRR
jgi:hypothetical protein